MRVLMLFAERLVAEEEWELLRRHERTGRPLGGEGFVADLESVVGRQLRPHKRGPKGPWKHGRKD